MNYQDTVNWMFKQLPMYQNQGASAYKEDLSNTTQLANHLNNPQHKFKSIHVAGTNGKGSTSHMLASMLQEAGYKVGLYTSPHLRDFRERIKINGKPVSKQFVIGFIKRHSDFFQETKLSFFEMTVGMAFDYFAKQKVDIAIIEVGLGGRLDSTNIITPELSVITNIGFDHMKFLGNTLESIATEKAGIIKRNIPVVIGEYQQETTPFFNTKAEEKNSKIYFAQEYIKEHYPSDLRGNYQSKNIKTAVQAIHVLTETSNFLVSEDHIRQGLMNVVKNTGLNGRWQILGEHPKVICDTAHNKEGLTIVLNQLGQEQFDNLHIVIGVVKDKDLNSIVSLFPDKATYYFCKPNVVRGLEAKELKTFFGRFGLKGDSYKTVQEALSSAKNNAASTDLIFVGGSTFTVAEII
ncbi:MAG: bifunctional folylpolyglutamate synthase/dihydrofolate synthase [Psychroserpens sp.]|nr:bifunctional folylpolyglutamate synthase/dihydrofolate synthase [Psychroserpens sp.]